MMGTVFVSKDIWPHLTKAARGSRGKCAAAVAYFGKGASRLLPLPKGSRLVVDASEGAVASGQTCPAELIKLQKRNVAVYSVSNLHAKVFVLGNAAYIGSANASGRSATQLIEATIRTTERGAVRAARKFIQENSLHELTPTVLRRLAKLYRPPRIAGGKKGRRQKPVISSGPVLPRLLIAQLHLGDWSERDQSLHDEAMVVAKKRQKHPRTFELDSFRVAGKCRYQRGDLVIQVTDEGAGKVMVAPPGNVLHVRTRTGGRFPISFVYLELQARRRRHIKAVARVLGYGSLKQLHRDGMIRKASFAQALLSAWAR
jgi:hypothetical protein